MGNLVLRDEIHADMSFDWLVRRVIDHECFQRLRYIKQLGLAEYVFPCATHTRFQHSLGASYLAGQYFQSLLKYWSEANFSSDIRSGETLIHTKRTKACVVSVAQDPASAEFWHQAVSLAGLLHDVGHGPWSHTFEELNLDQDFSSITKTLSGKTAAYFASLKTLKHEDLSVLYAFHIFSTLEKKGLKDAVAKYFLPIAALINKKFLSFDAKAIESDITQTLGNFGLRGGAEFHRLLRPMISGPFDVDRIDYIQRDGRNCGVSIGGIEWRRIVSKLIPCLAEYSGRANESKEVVLISNYKNQHVLDDFVFSLFQMYAQVYMHPKTVGVEETFCRILAEKVQPKSKMTVTFDLHKSLSDEKFRDLLRSSLGITEIDDILFRKEGCGLDVVSYPEDAGFDDKLKEQGYRLVDTQNRPMMKDSLGVFLFASPTEGDVVSQHMTPWVSVSPIAKQFYAISYAPRIWIKQG